MGWDIITLSGGGKMKQIKWRSGIIFEIAILFLVGIIMTGLITYFSESRKSDRTVKQQTEQRAEEIASEAKAAVTQYPAYKWLVNYWYKNNLWLDIEYDALYEENTDTLEKCNAFSERHPDLQLLYLTEDQCESLPPEDQKLYAEITYSWLLTRIDQIKKANNVDYLFCVVTEEPYINQFFLFSGAEPGTRRGVKSDESYILGKTVTVAKSQTEAMKEAIKKESHLADADGYVDYYSTFMTIDGHIVLIGVTYNLSDLLASIQSQTNAATRYAIYNLILLSMTVLLFLLIFVIYPLRRVQKYISEYKETKESRPIVEGLSKVKLHNEIGRLAEDVSALSQELDFHMEKTATATADKERINTELTMASRIQLAMLPNKFPERSEFDIYASMDPAKAVGGDFYDFFQVDDDHLALVIADVSGKGIPAALFMMVSKILVKNYTKSGLSPARALEAANDQICSNNQEDMFVTVWLGILEISTGKLTAANAGHEYPVLKTPEGKFELIKDKHGVAVGVMEGVHYREYEWQLSPGSKLFVYTDGVPEATDASRQLFGTERMLAALNEKSDAAFPKQLLLSVRRAVDNFVKDAEQFDDLTMLCLEYLGSKKEETIKN